MGKVRRATARWAKLLLKGMGGLILFLAVLLLLLSLPMVQTGIANFAAQKLSKQTDSRIEIDRVHINFIKGLALRNLYMEDPSGDTLLYTGRLKVDIALPLLLKKRVQIDRVLLDKAVLHLVQDDTGRFNFQHLVDRFASQDPVPKEPPDKPFEISVKSIMIGDLYGTADLKDGANSARLEKLEVQMNSMDPGAGSFDVKRIEIDGLTGSSTWNSVERTASQKSQQKKIFGFPLENLPVTILCDKLLIHDSRVNYNQGATGPSPYFDAKRLHGNNLNLEIHDVRLDSTAVAASIRNIRLDLNNSAHLRSFAVDAVYANHESSVKDLKLEFNNSVVALEATTEYDDFGDLIALSDEVKTGLSIQQLLVDPHDVMYFIPALERIPEIQPFTNQIVEVKADIEGGIADIGISELQITSGPHTVAISGNYSGLPNLEKLSASDGAIDISTSVSALRPFLGDSVISSSYERFGKIDLAATFSSTMDSLSFSDLKLNTSSLLSAELSGSVSRLNDIGNLTYNININKIESGYADALAFSDNLPQMLQLLDTISYRGTLRGGLRTYDLNGGFITSLGAVSTDIDMEFNENFSNADYSGSVSLQDFKIGRLLDVDSLGNITITCSVDGSGMTPDSLKASSIIHVEKVDYNGYNYQDISLNGDFERRMFTGDLTIRDEHLYMDLSGAFNMNDSIPAMKFNADIDRLDLHALNFASDTFSIHAGISADFSGIDPDDADGRILVTDLAMKKNKRHWSADTVAIVALKDFTGRRDISINSPVARGTLTGEFSFSHLTAMLTDFADDYFHVGELLTDSDSSATTEEEIFTEEYAELSLDVEDLVPLAELFNINLTRMDAAHLYFLLDDRRKILDLEFDIPYVQYGTMAVDSFRLRADNTNGSLNTFVNTGKVDLAEGVSIPEAEIKLTAAGQKADVQLTLAGDSARQRLDLNTHWHSTPGQIQLEIGDSMVLNGKDWSVDMKDPFTFYRNSVDFPSIAIQSGEEVLRMEERKGMLGIDLLNFDVANLTGLVDYGGGTIGGALIGNVDLGLKKDQPIFIGDLDLRSLYLNTDTIGNLSLSAGSDGQTAWAALDFTGGGSEATAEANYDLKSRLIDGEVVLERINLSTFEKILVNYVSETSGYIDGNIHLKGAVSAPEIDGRLNFTNASAFVVPAQTRYSISTGELVVTSDNIIPDMTFLDEEGREARLEGKINHHNFSNIIFDMRFHTEGFTFLNSEQRNDDLYFGKFVGKVNASISGDPKLPKIKASLTTLDESDMTVQLLSKQAIMRQEEYMMFYNGKNNYTLSQLDSIAKERYNIHSGVDLTLNVSIRDNSQFRLVIDPLTGDNLEIKGNADLVVRIPPSGNLSITGIFTVEEGNYRFSYQSMLKRDFGIEKGSSIRFTGNLMEALLNIRAVYATQASTYALLQSEIGSMSDSEIRSLRRKSDVSVLLNIAGKLSSPELSFDIRLDDDAQGSYSSSVDRILNRLREDESELNKQVFSLMLFNSFTGVSSSGNATTATSGTAIRSVGNMINSQLNRLTNNAEGLVIDFDLDQYSNVTNDSESDLTEIELGISKSLFQDKLTISVGSSITLEGGNAEGGALSDVAGDFVLEYKITEGGKYRVKVFQTADYDNLVNDNIWKTGVGFSYQTRFGSRRIKKQKDYGAD